MTRTHHLAALAAAAAVAAGCADLGTAPTNPLASAIASAAFATVPLGYSDLTTSYAGDGTLGPAIWLPGAGSVAFDMSGSGGGGHGGPGGHGGHRGPGGDLMGGGLDDAFVGGIGGGGRRGHHGPFGGALGGFGRGALRCDGAFDAAAGRFVCTPVTRNGVTTTRSARYTAADGTVQQAFDTLTTNAVNVRTSTTGTLEYTRDTTSGRGGRGHRHVGRITGDTTTILTATTQVSHESDRTVYGLAQGSTARTVDGTSTGTESTTGTSSRGSFTATRSAQDVTAGVVVPLQDGRPTYPTAGTVTRTMTATVTFAGQAPATSTRREVVTYDGSATAKVTITQDGVTRNCTLPLPRGRLTCSE